ncbi:MAG: acetylserotonin O-methyltransferase [Methanoregula sp.]|nr:acetylserotonin O-methyltransferase [Methanoregula sp.]
MDDPIITFNPNLELLPPEDIGKLQELAHAVETYRIVATAVELGVFDALDEPKTSDELADRLGLQKKITGKFCNALVASGFMQQIDGHFAPTDSSRAFFRKKSPFYQGNLINLWNTTRNDRWSHLSEIIRNGPEGYEDGLHGVFDAGFVHAMAEGAVRGSLQKTIEFMKNYPGFRNVKTMLDLGGGHGLYSIAFTQMNPGLFSTVLDLPSVVKQVTSPMISTYHADRVTAIPGDFTKDNLGPGYDMVFASDVLYREKTQMDAILGRVHSSLNNDGIFISKHWHIDDIVRDATAVYFDLMFSLAEDTDRVYSSAEFSRTLESNGFEIEKVHDLNTPFHPSRIIVSRKVAR